MHNLAVPAVRFSADRMPRILEVRVRYQHRVYRGLSTLRARPIRSSRSRDRRGPRGLLLSPPGRSLFGRPFCRSPFRRLLHGSPARFLRGFFRRFLRRLLPRLSCALRRRLSRALRRSLRCPLRFGPPRPLRCSDPLARFRAQRPPASTARSSFACFGRPRSYRSARARSRQQPSYLLQQRYLRV
jgi:hypothetical protein